MGGSKTAPRKQILTEKPEEQKTGVTVTSPTFWGVIKQGGRGCSESPPWDYRRPEFIKDAALKVKRQPEKLVLAQRLKEGKGVE